MSDLIEWREWKPHLIDRPVDCEPQRLARTGSWDRWFEVKGALMRTGTSA